MCSGAACAAPSARIACLCAVWLHYTVAHTSHAPPLTVSHVRAGVVRGPADPQRQHPAHQVVLPVLDVSGGAPSAVRAVRNTHCQGPGEWAMRMCCVAVRNAHACGDVAMCLMCLLCRVVAATGTHPCDPTLGACTLLYPHLPAPGLYSVHRPKATTYPHPGADHAGLMQAGCKNPGVSHQPPAALSISQTALPLPTDCVDIAPPPGAGAAG